MHSFETPSSFFSQSVSLCYMLTSLTVQPRQDDGLMLQFVFSQYHHIPCTSFCRHILQDPLPVPVYLLHVHFFIKLVSAARKTVIQLCHNKCIIFTFRQACLSLVNFLYVCGYLFLSFSMIALFFSSGLIFFFFVKKIFIMENFKHT